MNKLRLLSGGILILALSLVIWSCKDDFTEEDQLKLQAELALEKDSVALAINVYDASSTSHSFGGRTSGAKGLADVTVSLSVNGSIRTATTGATGIANFIVQPGSLAGTISATDFATANFVITVLESEDGEGAEQGEKITNAAVTLPAFANAGPTVATVTGNVTFEGNLLNDTREPVPNGTVITFSPDAADLLSYYQTITSTGADVDAYSLEGPFTATTAGGVYTALLPTGVNGLSYDAEFSDFTADQSIAINNLTNDPVGGSIRDVRTFPTQFGPNISINNDEFDDIPFVDATQVDVAAPPAAGTGAAVTARLDPQGAGGIAGSFAVINGGSGYGASLTNVPVTVTGGDFDNTVTGQTPAVLFATTDANGGVTAINIVGGTLGFGYRSQPTIAIGGAGTGAVVRSNYQSTVRSNDAILTSSGSAITAAGSGYLEDVPPILLVTGFNNDNDQITETIALTVNNGAVVRVLGGSTQFARIASATVIPVARAQAFAVVGINSLGEVTSASNNGAGAGYSPAASPAVTVRGLRGGTGAAVNAVVLNNAITTYIILNRGSGYSFLEANFPVNGNGIAFSGSFSQTLKPGQTVVSNAYYGTGRRSQGVE